MRKAPIQWRAFAAGLVLLSSTAKAQTWYQPGQTYARIEVVDSGLYVLTYSDLAAVFPSLGSIDPRSFQMYWRGQPYPIYVHGESDGSFDPGDYVLFYGQPNDGTPDIPLYVRPSDQPNRAISLYSDTNVYYLGIGASPGSRIQFVSTTPSATRPDADRFRYRQRKNFITQYYDDLNSRSGNYIKSSYYEAGEGWMSKEITQYKDYNVYFSASNRATPAAARFRTYVTTRSNDPFCGYRFNNKYSINVRYRQGSVNVSYPLVGDSVMISGLHDSTFDISMPDYYLSDQLRIQYFAWHQQCATAISIAYAELEYSHTLQINDLSVPFELTTIGGGAPEHDYVFRGIPGSVQRPWIYQLDSHVVYRGQYAGDSLRVALPAGSSFYFLDSAGVQSPSRVTSYRFSDLLGRIDPNTDYLIVTHTSLKAGAEAFAAYRRSTGYTVSTVYADSFYDHFYYGLHHPMAVKRFFEAIYDRYPQIPLRFVFLLGKGIQARSLLRGVNNGRDLIPTWGVPPSDYIFVSDLKDSLFLPDLYMGRLAALSNEAVMAYLDKVRTHEQLGDEPWRKHILHLSGGRDVGENEVFSAGLNQCAQIAQDTPAGMGVTLIRKSDDLPVSTTLKQKIIGMVNRGLGMTSYFGHGAADILEIDIGEPYEYHNVGRYPVMYFAGCILGNCYTTSSAGERFLMTDSVGALVWLAGTNYSELGPLTEFNTAFYQSAFRDKYGRPIGEILNHAMHLFYRPHHDLTYRMQSLQFNLQGDPAVRLYSPQRPDYEVTVKSVSFSPQPLHAQLDSFETVVAVHNWGRAIADTLTIRLIRTFPQGGRIDTFHYHVTAPFYLDTFRLRLPMEGKKGFGQNIIRVTLDPDNRWDELREDNNEATVATFVYSNAPIPLSPIRYTLVPSRSVTLRAQGTAPTQQTFEFEIDTTPFFTSPWKQTSGPVQGVYSAEWPVMLAEHDSTAYYWRVRLLFEDGDTSEWATASFTYAAGTLPGWGQVHFHQHTDSRTAGLRWDSTTRTLQFARSVSAIVKAQTTGIHYPDAAATEIRYDYARMIFGYLESHVHFVAFNPDDLSLFSYPSPYSRSTRIPASPAGFFSYFLHTQQWRDSFIAMINRIPDGYHVVLITGRSANNFPLWLQDSALADAMRSIGAVKVFDISGPNWPYICIGQKGAYTPALEILPDTSPGAPSPTYQILSASATFTPSRKEGFLFSTRIGPARSWEDMEVRWKHRSIHDTIFTRVWGISRYGRRELVSAYSSAFFRPLDHVNADSFPYLELELWIEDERMRTPAQLKSWIVHYEGLPDLTVHPGRYFYFHADTLWRGDTLRFGIAIENYTTDTLSDSVNVRFSIVRRHDRTVAFTTEAPLLGPMPPGALDTVTFAYNVTPLEEGDYELQMEVNPADQPRELNRFNNFLALPFYVRGDHLNPIVDVTFDGKHIFNGEVVSPTPEVRITGRDDHPFFYLDDTTYLTVAVRFPGDTAPRRLAYTDPTVEFIPSEGAHQPAEFYWRPERLPDGVYTLEVTLRDEEGNLADSPSLALDFEVINATTISHLLPYPNPFTTATRFVYTITGEVPDRLTVYILSITGEVVKEIPLHEYDAFEIGQNISSYVWDGTTDDGVPLANGVYLYKVAAYRNGEPVKVRDWGTARYFKHGVGKLVILR